MESLNIYYNKLLEVTTKANKNGLFHIIISSSLVKAVSFISAIFLPRIINDKVDYGLLVYIDNIRAYILLANGIGIANASLRFCAKEKSEQKRKGYFLATIFIGVIFDVIVIILSIILYNVFHFQFKGARELLLLTSILPLFIFLFEDIQMFLRACFDNKKYSVLSFIYSFFMVVFQIVFGIFAGLKGVVFARYLAVGFAIILGMTFVKNITTFKVQAIFPKKQEIKSMVKFGINMMLSNSTSLVLQINETFILGIMLKNESLLADYKVASYILVISTFIVQSVAVFIFPYFTKNMDDKIWIWKNFKKLSLLNAIVTIPVHFVLIVAAKLFVTIVFGIRYINVVPIMQMILVASLGLSILRILTGNILAAIGEEKFNLRINIIFIVIHVLADVWAIKAFGINGAAIALSIVYYTSGIIMIWYLWKVCHKAKLSMA